MAQQHSVALKDVQNLQLRKEDLEGLLAALSADDDGGGAFDRLVTGAFARVLVFDAQPEQGGASRAKVPRIGRVAGVETKDGDDATYPLGAQQTAKYLRLAVAGGCELLVKMSQLSDATLTEQDFATWCAAVDAQGARPARRDLMKKWLELRKASARFAPKKPVAAAPAASAAPAAAAAAAAAEAPAVPDLPPAAAAAEPPQPPAPSVVVTASAAAFPGSTAPPPAFLAAPVWQGNRPGYYFGGGPHGVGYYADTPLASGARHAAAVPPPVPAPAVAGVPVVPSSVVGAAAVPSLPLSLTVPPGRLPPAQQVAAGVAPASAAPAPAAPAAGAASGSSAAAPGQVRLRSILAKMKTKGAALKHEVIPARAAAPPSSLSAAAAAAASQQHTLNNAPQHQQQPAAAAAAGGGRRRKLRVLGVGGAEAAAAAAATALVPSAPVVPELPSAVAAAAAAAAAEAAAAEAAAAAAEEEEGAAAAAQPLFADGADAVNLNEARARAEAAAAAAAAEDAEASAAAPGGDGEGDNFFNLSAATLEPTAEQQGAGGLYVSNSGAWSASYTDVSIAKRLQADRLRQAMAAADGDAAAAAAAADAAAASPVPAAAAAGVAPAAEAAAFVPWTELPAATRQSLSEEASRQVAELMAQMQEEAERGEREVVVLDAELARLTGEGGEEEAGGGGGAAGNSLSAVQEALRAAEEAYEEARSEAKETVEEAAAEAAKAKEAYVAVEESIGEGVEEFRGEKRQLNVDARLLQVEVESNREWETVLVHAGNALGDMITQQKDSLTLLKEMTEAEAAILRTIDGRNNAIADKCRALKKRKAELTQRQDAQRVRCGA